MGMKVMKRDKAINLLKKQFSVLHTRYGVRHLSLFGSVARDESKATSDVDMMVEFQESPTFDRFMDLKFFLEELLHTRVDLVTKDALRPQLRAGIEKELIHVA
jgi:predicted nucleotidyltransferase